MLLLTALDLDDAAYAEYVLTCQTDRAVSDGEADWAEVVVELWHNRYQFLRELSADILADAAGHELTGLYKSPKGLGNAQRGTLVELCERLGLVTGTQCTRSFPGFVRVARLTLQNLQHRQPVEFLEL